MKELFEMYDSGEWKKYSEDRGDKMIMFKPSELERVRKTYEERGATFRPFCHRYAGMCIVYHGVYDLETEKCFVVAVGGDALSVDSVYRSFNATRASELPDTCFLPFRDLLDLDREGARKMCVYARFLKSEHERRIFV